MRDVRLEWNDERLKVLRSLIRGVDRMKKKGGT
jgi:hypothetical protein